MGILVIILLCCLVLACLYINRLHKNIDRDRDTLRAIKAIMENEAHDGITRRRLIALEFDKIGYMTTFAPSCVSCKQVQSQ